MMLVPLLLAAMILLLPTSRWLTARWLGVKGLTFSGIRPAPEYFRASLGRRLLIRAAGPFTLWILVAAMAGCSLRLTGIARLTLELQPLPGQPAAAAGMQTGDTVVTVAGEPVTTFEDFRSRVQRHSGQAVEVEVDRAGARVTLRPTVDSRGRIGVTARAELVPVSLPGACIRGMAFPARILWALGRGMAARPSESVAGPATSGGAPSGPGSAMGDYLAIHASVGSMLLAPLAIADALLSLILWVKLRRSAGEAK